MTRVFRQTMDIRFQIRTTRAISRRRPACSYVCVCVRAHCWQRVELEHRAQSIETASTRIYTSNNNFISSRLNNNNYKKRWRFSSRYINCHGVMTHFGFEIISGLVVIEIFPDVSGRKSWIPRFLKTVATRYVIAYSCPV